MLIYVCFFYPDEWQGEIKKLPLGFKLLASTPECRIQVRAASASPNRERTISP